MKSFGLCKSVRTAHAHMVGTFSKWKVLACVSLYALRILTWVGTSCKWKVSVYVSLYALRMLTWIGTFCKWKVSVYVSLYALRMLTCVGTFCKWKISAYVSLHAPRMLTWLGTFCKCIKAPFHRARLILYSLNIIIICMKRIEPPLTADLITCSIIVFFVQTDS